MNKLCNKVISHSIVAILIIFVFSACPVSNDDTIPEDSDVLSDLTLPDFTESVFVSSTGIDTNPGTLTLPVKTVSYGLSIAETDGKDFVLVASGTYNENSTITLKDGISIYGSLIESSGWLLSDTVETTLNITSNKGIDATSISLETSLNYIRIITRDAIQQGESTYGLFISNSSNITIRNCEIEAGNGIDAPDAPNQTGSAMDGNDGALGQAGCEDSTFTCGSCSQPVGGAGGAVSGLSNGGGSGGSPAKGNIIGSAGGPSEDGTPGGSGTPQGKYDWSPPSQYWGVDGANGSTGTNGASGNYTYLSTGYSPLNGEVGTNGTPGKGGGGGGGGGGGSSNCDSYGGAGGGGGSGGAGGLGADGGIS